MHHHAPANLWDLSFSELWHPIYAGVLILIAVIYCIAVRKHKGEKAWTKPVNFMLGIFFLYAASGSPIYALGKYYLFSVHMFSMSIEFFIVPPLILAGVYSWMLEPVTKRAPFRQILHFFLNPILAVALFNILLSFYHIPLIFDWIMSKEIYMQGADLVLYFFAFMMWWLIIEPVKNTRSISHLAKLGYVFAASILLTPACAMITFAGTVMYDKIMMEPQIVWFLTHIQDQSTGGVIMKVIQELVFACTFGYIFYQWHKYDKQQDESGNDLNPTHPILSPRLK